MDNSNRWTLFRDRLPTQADADGNGRVMALERTGVARSVLWRWTHTAASWEANGFLSWAPIARTPGGTGR